MTSFLVVGEALVDIIVRACESAVEHVGGSPANVAYGLARLADQVALLTQVGADERGETITGHLRSAGVTVLATDSSRPTSTARATIGPDGSATYAFDVTWSVDIELAPPADVVHVGSIGALLAPGADAVRTLVTARRGSSLISFDPNIRPPLLGSRDVVAQRVEHLVALSDIVKVSADDLEWLYPAASPVESAAAWAALGASLVVLTKGAAGLTAFWHGARVDLPGPIVRVVDTVGAGDSFTAGLLDALGRALPGHGRDEFNKLGLDVINSALQWALAASAVTVSRAGADLPTRAEVAAEVR